MDIQSMLESLNESPPGGDKYWVHVVYDPTPKYTLGCGSMSYMGPSTIGELQGEYDPDFKPTSIVVGEYVPWRRIQPLIPFLELR